MDRAIPGSEAVEGREFIYVETSEAEDFHAIMEKVFAGFPETRLPTAGGAIEEKARILLEAGRSLLAISYKGDLPGWRGRLVGFCENTGRQWGIARDGTLVLANGTETPLSECDVRFEE